MLPSTVNATLQCWQSTSSNWQRTSSNCNLGNSLGKKNTKRRNRMINYEKERKFQNHIFPRVKLKGVTSEISHLQRTPCTTRETAAPLISALCTPPLQYRECTRARSQSDCSIEYGRSIVSEVHPKYVRNFRSFRTLSEVRALFL